MRKKAEKVEKEKPVKSTQKVSEVGLFYADKVKYERAQILVSKGEYKKVKDAYVAIGGLLTEGYGYAEV